YHSDNILRSQKRRSVRAPARISARLYPLKGLEEANQWIESNPGLSCLISDISEDGAALRIGGRGRKNQPFKLQFKIRNEIVIVSGVVKRVQYKPKEDESTLHVEFLPPPENTRMILLSYVFDIDRSRTEGNLKENQDALSVISGITPGDEDDEEPTEVIPEDEDAEDAEEVAELEEVPDDETG
ncbi:MAG: PilZ domain-containing protein, partial [Spirochaetaceae bacterium]|nr:PilZ domain-containing protein [Spirochaetaceae bacterium]